MAITFELAWDEGPLKIGGTRGSGQLRFIGKATEGESRYEVLAAFSAYPPTSMFGLFIESVGINERLGETGEDGVTDTESYWLCTADYVAPESKQQQPLKAKDPDLPQPVRWSIRSGPGSSETRTMSLSLIEDRARTGTFKWDDPAYDDRVKKLLGLETNANGDSASHFSVMGISVPTGNIEVVVETIKPYKNAVTDGWLVKAAEYVARQCTNAVAWEGFPVGSLRLATMEATQREEEQLDPLINRQPFDVTIVMAYEPEAEIETDGMPAFTRKKRGHEYLDRLYVEQEVEVDPFTGEPKIIIPVLERLALHQIYPEINFVTDLGLSIP